MECHADVKITVIMNIYISKLKMKNNAYLNPNN